MAKRTHRFKDAGTGKFVSEETAKANPKTTYKRFFDWILRRKSDA